MAIVVGLVGDAWILQSGWKVWLASVTFLLLGASCGFSLAWLAGLPRRQCRTVALECGIQNSTLSLTILAFTFPERADQRLFRVRALPHPSQRMSPSRRCRRVVLMPPPPPPPTTQEVARFPLLYSLFLIIDACLLTALFRHLAKADPAPEGKAEVRPRGDKSGNAEDAEAPAPPGDATPASAVKADSTARSDVEEGSGAQAKEESAAL